MEARLPALQGIGLRVGDDVGAELQLPGQRLLQAGHDVALPAVVLLGCHGAAAFGEGGGDRGVVARAEVDVREAAVEDEARVLAEEPVDECRERGVALAGNVAVGVVQHAVGHEAVLGNLIAAQRLVQTDVQHELLRERTERGTQVVGLLHIEIGVTVGDAGGCRAVDVGVQIADARTREAHVVGQAEVLRGLRREAQREAGHEVAVVAAEVGTRTLQVAHLLERVLIAQAGLRTHDAHLGGILGIGGSDVVVVAVFHVAQLRRLPVGMRHVAVFGPRAIVAHDVFSAQTERVAWRQGAHVVELQRLFERLRLVLAVEVERLEVGVYLLGGSLLRRV